MKDILVLQNTINAEIRDVGGEDAFVPPRRRGLIYLITLPNHSLCVASNCSIIYER
jgi:hypothetical protein